MTEQRARLSDVQVDRLQWTLDNIYTVARREAARQYRDERTLEMWRHVIRLCEGVGCQPRVVLKADPAAYEGDY